MLILGALLPIIAIGGGLLVGIVAILARSRTRELLIRERIAMIEKGLVPPPEMDPAGFERAMGRVQGLGDTLTAIRYRRSGIVLIGIGVGLAVLISLVNEPRVGVGVGGFVAVLGVAFVVSSLVDRGSREPGSRSSPPRIPPPTV